MKYFHNIAHDGSVSPLLGFLQISTMVWPGMGSEVISPTKWSPKSWYLIYKVKRLCLSSIASPTAPILNKTPTRRSLILFECSGVVNPWKPRRPLERSIWFPLVTSSLVRALFLLYSRVVKYVSLNHPDIESTIGSGNDLFTACSSWRINAEASLNKL